MKNWLIRHVKEFRKLASRLEKNLAEDPAFKWYGMADDFLSRFFLESCQRVTQQLNALKETGNYPPPFNAPMCTTLSAGVVVHDQAAVRYAGDSPVLLYSPKRDIFRKLTIDHHHGLEENFTMSSSPDSESLTRVIGAKGFSKDKNLFIPACEKGDPLRIQLEKDDLLLLASDGLIDCIDALTPELKADAAEKYNRTLAGQGVTVDCLGVGGDFNFKQMQQFSGVSSGRTELLDIPEAAGTIFLELLEGAQTSLINNAVLRFDIPAGTRDIELYQLTPEIRYFDTLSSSPDGSVNHKINLQNITQTNEYYFLIQTACDIPKDSAIPNLELFTARLDFDIPILGKKGLHAEQTITLNLTDKGGIELRDTGVDSDFMEASIEKLDQETSLYAAKNDWKKVAQLLNEMYRISDKLGYSDKAEEFQRRLDSLKKSLRGFGCNRVKKSRKPGEILMDSEDFYRDECLRVYKERNYPEARKLLIRFFEAYKPNTMQRIYARLAMATSLIECMQDCDSPETYATEFKNNLEKYLSELKEVDITDLAPNPFLDYFALTIKTTGRSSILPKC